MGGPAASSKHVSGGLLQMFTEVEQETYLKAPKKHSPNYSGIACVHVPK